MFFNKNEIFIYIKNKNNCMKEKTNIEKTLNNPFFKIIFFFIVHSYEEIHLRGLARRLKISPYSTKKFLDFLVSHDLILEEKKANMRYFKANISNNVFKHMKIAFNLKKVYDSGLIDHIQNNVSALSSIVLFGSLARGEDSEESDMDLLVIGKKKKEFDITKFGEKLGREITCFVLSWSEWKDKIKEDKAFYQEIITSGILLFGTLPVIE
jgi:predicted nucleotidyltransferase